MWPHAIMYFAWWFYYQTCIEFHPNANFASHLFSAFSVFKVYHNYYIGNYIDVKWTATYLHWSFSWISVIVSDMMSRIRATWLMDKLEGHAKETRNYSALEFSSESSKLIPQIVALKTRMTENFSRVLWKVLWFKSLCGDYCENYMVLVSSETHFSKQNWFQLKKWRHRMKSLLSD